MHDDLFCCVWVSCNEVDNSGFCKKEDDCDSDEDMELDEDCDMVVYMDFIPRRNDAEGTVGDIGVLCQRQRRWI